MKKTTLSTVLVITFLILPVLVSAQNTNERMGSTSKETLKERALNKIDNLRENLRRIAKNRIEKMIKRFEDTIAREESIMNRIISRIEKIKTDGGKTTDAEKYITEAKMHFAEAKTALTTLKNATSSPDILVDANSATTSTIIKNGLKKLKDMAKEVEKHIREGHKSLTNAVKSLRGNSSTSNATTTSSN